MAAIQPRRGAARGLRRTGAGRVVPVHDPRAERARDIPPVHPAARRRRDLDGGLRRVLAGDGEAGGLRRLDRGRAERRGVGGGRFLTRVHRDAHGLRLRRPRVHRRRVVSRDFGWGRSRRRGRQRPGRPVDRGGVHARQRRVQRHELRRLRDAVGRSDRHVRCELHDTECDPPSPGLPRRERQQRPRRQPGLRADRAVGVGWHGALHPARGDHRRAHRHRLRGQHGRALLHRRRRRGDLPVRQQRHVPAFRRRDRPHPVRAAHLAR